MRAGNPVAHNNLGYAYVKLGETLDRTAANQYLRQAVAAYQEALRLARLRKGAEQSRRGVQQAGPVPGGGGSSRAARAKPDFAEAHYNLGTALYNRGQFKEAVANFNRLCGSKQDYADAYNSLGTALYKDQQFEPAIEAYKKTLRAEACECGDTQQSRHRLFQDQALLKQRRRLRKRSGSNRIMVKRISISRLRMWR